MSSGQDEDAGAGASASDFSPGSLVFATVVWLVTATFLALSFDFTERARVLPQFVGVPALIVASMLLVREVRAVILRQRVTAGERPAGEDAPAGQTGRNEAWALGWLAVLVLGVYLLGMLAGFTIFLISFLRIYARERWWLVLAVTVTLVAIIYFGFAEFFALRLYTGVIPPLLGL